MFIALAPVQYSKIQLCTNLFRIFQPVGLNLIIHCKRIVKTDAKGIFRLRPCIQ